MPNLLIRDPYCWLWTENSDLCSNNTIYKAKNGGIMIMEESILLFKCSQAQQLYGVRVQRMEDGDWWRTWAFKVKSQSAPSEEYGKTPVQSNLYATAEYPGCPYCGTSTLVKCGACQKFCCYHGETSLVCPWCGNKIENIVTATEKFNLTGYEF